mmetsp:Transcript_1694/g.6767  ORF Transcript_1694/g.6767 Transcript_1694/m.6767 type:complete len:327 (+) Transcript_1694:143-1123(+)
MQRKSPFEGTHTLRHTRPEARSAARTSPPPTRSARASPSRKTAEPESRFRELESSELGPLCGESGAGSCSGSRAFLAARERSRFATDSARAAPASLSDGAAGVDLSFGSFLMSRDEAIAVTPRSGLLTAGDASLSKRNASSFPSEAPLPPAASSSAGESGAPAGAAASRGEAPRTTEARRSTSGGGLSTRRPHRRAHASRQGTLPRFAPLAAGSASAHERFSMLTQKPTSSASSVPTARTSTAKDTTRTAAPSWAADGSAWAAARAALAFSVFRAEAATTSSSDPMRIGRFQASSGMYGPPAAKPHRTSSTSDRQPAAMTQVAATP